VNEKLRALTTAYARLLLIILALIPSYAIAYLYLFQSPSLRFENARFHEIAIGVSILLLSFGVIRTFLSADSPYHTDEEWLKRAVGASAGT
jgi:hypothetical protein